MQFTVLIVDDDDVVRESVSEYLRLHNYLVLEAQSISACCDLLLKNNVSVILLDYRLPDGDAIQALPKVRSIAPDLPVVILTGYGTIELAVRAMKEGAEQFLTKPVQLSVMEEIIRKVVESRRAMRQNTASRMTRGRYERDPFFGESPLIKKLEREVHKILGTNRPVLIQGETGTGKGVLAEWIHKNGPRAAEAFVDVNCAGLPRDLVESELFGHEKGAFTGAMAAKAGLLEAAHQGTLFLDEIGDLELALQPKLLKVLEERKLRRLGQVNERIVDVHLIAATHRDLAEMVEQNKFRADLFFRINTINLNIPPLRERPQDIAALSDYFLRQFERDMGRGPFRLSDDARNVLQRYSWPGNIRELRNVLERATLVCDSGVLTTEDLNLRTSNRRPQIRQELRNQTLAMVEQQAILAALDQEGGDVVRAARRLDIPRSTLYSKLRAIKHVKQAAVEEC
jgi:DNA-binding NtrC family response regulator